jgi:hypothetical protein
LAKDSLIKPKVNKLRRAVSRQQTAMPSGSSKTKQMEICKQISLYAPFWWFAGANLQ